MKKIFIFEDKVKNWIEKNRFTWCCILFGTGLSLGFFALNLLGNNNKQGIIAGFTYGFILVITEIGIGGSGID